MKLLSDGPDVHYIVRRDPDQVCAGLADELRSDGEFAGRVSGRTFRIRTNLLRRNAFRPYLYGRVEPALEGSRIIVRLGLHPLTRYFVVTWLGVMLLIGLVVLVLYLTKSLGPTPRGPDPGAMLLAPPSMFAGCIAAAWIGRIWGQGEETRLLRFADERWGLRVASATPE